MVSTAVRESNSLNNFAISTSDLASSLTKSASALVTAGVGLEQGAALLTGANTIMQDPASVSQGLKIIALRIRGVKTELENMGESTDDVLNTAKLQEKIKGLSGVDILGDDGGFRSIYDILIDIADVWDKLDSMSQAAIVEIMAGKNRSNVFTSLMVQADTIKEAYQVALEAEGSALQENEKYLTSIQGHIDKFNNSLQTMWHNELDSDAVKTLVDIGRVLVETIDKVGLLNVAFGALAAISAFKKDNMGIFSWFAKFIQAEKANAAASREAAAANLEEAKAAKVAGAANLEESIDSGIAAAADKAEAGASIFKSGTKAAKLLKGALGGIGGIILSLALSYLPKLIDEVIVTKKEMIEAANEISTEFKNAKESINNDLKTLEGLDGEFKQLSKGVDDYGNNISLAADDYERYREIVSTILGISPSLISGYDAEGNAIANKNGLLEQSIALMKEEYRLRAQDFVSDDNLVTVGMGAVAAMAEYEKENPLPYGDAMSDFRQKFLEVANNFDVRGGQYVDSGDFLKLFSPEGYNLYNYYSGDVANFGEDFYDQIVYSLRNERDKFKDQLTEEEINALLEIASEYEKNVNTYNRKIEEYSKALNPTLQYAPQSLTAYSELTNDQKAFLTQYVNSFRITADTTKQEFKKMKQDILEC